MCDVNARNYVGKTTLMMVCDHHYDKLIGSEMIGLLLDNGADINSTTKYDCTALMYHRYNHSSSLNLLNNNFENTIVLLIRRGANVLACASS